MTGQPSNEQRINGILGRLEAVLDIENARIGKDVDFDLNRSNAVKSRCLYDMTLLLRDQNPASLGPAHSRQLEIVRGKLAANSVKVKAHMDAVREVTEILKDAVVASEADGTYSIDQFMAYDLP